MILRDDNTYFIYQHGLLGVSLVALPPAPLWYSERVPLVDPPRKRRKGKKGKRK